MIRDWLFDLHKLGWSIPAEVESEAADAALEVSEGSDEEVFRAARRVLERRGAIPS